MKTCKKCGTEKMESDFQLKRYKDRQWREGTCKDCRNAASRKRRSTPKGKRSNRNSLLKYKYGLTADQVDKMVDDQGGCGICGTRDPEGNWHVDHDHSCCDDQYKTCGACIRGILCRDCNLLLGFARDDIDRLRSAVSFLERTQRQSPV